MSRSFKMSSVELIVAKVRSMNKNKNTDEKQE